MDPLHIISKSLLYACGPFFCYPWKPLINEISGVHYDVAYKHFWAQHKDPLNLAWHLVCLFFQLFGNFAFLAAIESPAMEFLGVSTISPFRLFVDRPISLLSAMLWISILIVPRTTAVGNRDCPLIAKFISVVCIITAYRYAPTFTGHQIEINGILAFFVVWVISLFTRKSKVAPKPNSLLILVTLTVKVLVYYFIVLNNGLRGSLASHFDRILPVFLVGLVLCSSRHDPVAVTVVYGCVIGHILSALVDSATLFLFCCAFTATLFQGLSHAVSGEDGTLIVLQTDNDEKLKLSYEWSHVVFFPNILLHACMQRVNLVGKAL